MSLISIHNIRKLLTTHVQVQHSTRCEDNVFPRLSAGSEMTAWSQRSARSNENIMIVCLLNNEPLLSAWCQALQWLKLWAPGHSFGWLVCCLMTPGLSKEFSVIYDHTFYKQVQISRSDIRPHIKWAVSLVILHMVTSIFLQALCGYIWVNILTLSPRGGIHSGKYGSRYSSIVHSFGEVW